MTQSWMTERVRLLQLHTAARGLRLSGSEAERIVAGQRRAVATQMCISERRAQLVLTRDTVEGLAAVTARTRTAVLAGADLFGLPRSASITGAECGRAVASMAEAMLVYRSPTTTVLADADERITELGTLLSVLGMIQADHSPAGPFRVPPALLTRSARCLDLAADVTASVDLSIALHRDATGLRSRPAEPGGDRGGARRACAQHTKRPVSAGTVMTTIGVSGIA